MELGRKKCVNGSQLPSKDENINSSPTFSFFVPPSLSSALLIHGWKKWKNCDGWDGWGDLMPTDLSHYLFLSLDREFVILQFLSELLDNFKEILWSQNSWRCLYKPTQPIQRKQFSVKTCTFDAQPRAEHHHPDAVLKKLDQIGLGRSATWICPPCQWLPCPWVGDVAWVRGEERDGIEEEGIFVADGQQQQQWREVF